MDKSTKHTILSLNILGIFCALLSLSFLFVFFYIGDKGDSTYYLGSFFTSLIVTILSFGFAKIISLLTQIRDKVQED